MNISETRLFSQCVEDNKMNAILRAGSVSDKDAAQRLATYQRVFSRYEDLKDQMRAFSGNSEFNVLTTQYFNATVSSYVRSFAGFLCMERDMDAPTAILRWMDMLGVTDGRKILPNLGKENLNGLNAQLDLDITNELGTTIKTVKHLLPGTVKVKVTTATGPYIIVDDRSGNLLAPAGVISAGTVDYANGDIDITLANGVTATAARLYAVEDVAGNPATNEAPDASAFNNRIKMEMQQIVCTATPDMLIAENNIMAIANMQKALNTDPQEIAGQKLTELYTKLINIKIVEAVKACAPVSSITFDGSTVGSEFTDYQSRLDSFMGFLIDVDNCLALKSVKGVKATAYVVAPDVAVWFRKCNTKGNFVDEPSKYLNDLVGYYNGIPVLQHENIKSGEGFAICKTEDGLMAPVMRGIYLPLTNTPTVGNYNNPSQLANGVYYSETNTAVLPELCVKFSIR